MSVMELFGSTIILLRISQFITFCHIHTKEPKVTEYIALPVRLLHNKRTSVTWAVSSRLLYLGRYSSQYYFNSESCGIKCKSDMFKNTFASRRYF